VDGYVSVNRGAIQKVAITLAFHALLVTFVFVLSKGVRRLFTEDLSTAASQFTVGFHHTITRLSDPIGRISDLFDQPENLGFALLGSPDPRVFEGVIPDLPPDSGDYSDPSTIPTRRPHTGGKDPCPFPTAYPEQVAQLQDDLLGIGSLDKASAGELACHFRKVTELGDQDALRLVEALSRRDSEEVRPLLRFVLLTRQIRAKHGLSPKQIDDVLRTWDATTIARQVENRGWRSLASMTSLTNKPPPATAKPTPKPTQMPTNVPTITEEPERDAQWLSSLFASQAQYLNCLPVQDHLLKAFLRYKRARAGGSAGLNVKEMKDLGFLQEFPHCPGSGTFQLVGDDAIRCSLHGNRKHPWKKAKQYRAYFRPWEIARETLEAGRPREALATANKFLKRQPNHAWMLEVLGEAALAQENPKVAAGAFYRICDTIWPKDTWSLYQAGLAFYASGNDVQALKHFQILLTSASWPNAKRRVASRLEYYRMLERTQWIVKTFLAPTKDGAPLPPVRFLEYKIARDPTWPADTCRANMQRSRDKINQFIVGYYDSPVLRRLYKDLSTLRRERLQIQTFEAQALKENQTQIQSIEKKIARGRREADARATGSVLRDLARMLGKEGLPAHPGANYRIDQDGDLHCVVHPFLLEDASLVGQTLTDKERAILNAALSKAVLLSQDGYRVCFQRQRDILAFWGDRLPVDFVADRVAAALHLTSPQEADCPTPGEFGGFTITSRKGNPRRLLCKTHGERASFFAAPAPSLKDR
jgi:tetratricopeptide (TPR) repeat protein